VVVDRKSDGRVWVKAALNLIPGPNLTQMLAFPDRRRERRCDSAIQPVHLK
jgi:hypothetical protein